MNLAVLFLLAQEVAAVGSSGPSLGSAGVDLLWKFANSPLGVVVVGGAVVHLLGWLFTKQPKFAKLFDEHKGVFFDAIRFAEEAVPAGSPNSGASKMKHALQFLEKLEHPILDAASEGDLKRALELAHAAEAAGSLAQQDSDARVVAVIGGSPKSPTPVSPDKPSAPEKVG